MIINADDLGMSEAVNDAIFRLLEERRISSATVMANAPAMRHALAQLTRFPDCSFGIHVNLTQFAPLTGGAGARLLVDERGEMSRAIETARPNQARLRAAYDEICAQIELLASLGQQISHLDSHHHVHTRPFLFPVLKAVQRRYGIRKVRIAKNFYSPEQPCPITLRAKKRAFNWALRHVYRTKTTDVFTELLTFHQMRHRRNLRCRSVELMTHPGAHDAGDELAVLRSDWLDESPARPQIVGYAQLGA